MLRQIEPTIPPAVITQLDARTRRFALGYFAGGEWRKRRGAAHEIAISPRLIPRPDELLATMLHEAAHAVLFEQGKRGGMGSTRYYHTLVFRDQCLAFGLDCAFQDTRYGWTLTKWPLSGAPKRFASVLKKLKMRLPAGTGGTLTQRPRGKKLPVSGHTPMTCGCEEPGRTIYVSKSVLAAGNIQCTICQKAFRAAT